MALRSLSRGRTEHGNSRLSLLKIRKVFEQAFYPGGREEDEHVVLDIRQVGQIAAHCIVHHCLGEIDALFFQCLWNARLKNVRAWKQELFLLVLLDISHELGEPELPMENLALPVDDILLEIMRSGFTDTEVFRGIRHFVSELSSHTEVVIYSIPRSKNDAAVLPQVNSLLPERLSAHALHMNEAAEVNLQLLLGGQIKVWRPFS